MKACFSHTKISAINTVVPSKVVHIDDELDRIYQGDQKALERIKKVIGLRTRHIAEPHITASDLGEYAATLLFQQTNLDPQMLDALIFVTQTPDYFLPATACYLHGKLNLPMTTIAFDINQACAGYLYGLYVAHSMIECRGAKKVLLLCGDTLSRLTNQKDSNLAPIIGDGVSATLLEYCESKNQAFFDLGTEGKKFYQLIIPEGAMRIPTPKVIPEPKIFQTSATRSLKELYMDGAEIFNFAILQESKSFQIILDYAKTAKEDLDYAFFHQANQYIVDHITKRLGLDPQKVPNDTTGKYGNLSGCSIPATICDILKTPLQKDLKIALAGFGAGLSFGNAILNLTQDFSCKPVQIYSKAIRGGGHKCLTFTPKHCNSHISQRKAG